MVLAKLIYKIMVEKKITSKEWRQYVEGQLHHHGFSQAERDVVRSVFDSHLKDSDQGEAKPFFGQPEHKISGHELNSTMEALKDKHSTLSNGLKIHLSDEKLEKLHGVLNEALEKNKERLF
jgi:hypothetical protein